MAKQTPAAKPSKNADKPTVAHKRSELAKAAAARKRRMWLVGSIVAGLVLVALIVTIVLVSTKPAAVATGGGFGALDIADGKPLVFGKKDAPNTIEIFFDAHCSHCREAEEKLGPTVKKHLDADRLQVHLYPEAFIDQGSKQAAGGLACAAKAGFGWQFYESIWLQPASAWTDDVVLKVGKQISAGSGADMDEFERCVTRKKFSTWVESMNKAGDAKGVTGTPTFIVNGQKIESKDATVQKIESLLK